MAWFSKDNSPPYVPLNETKKLNWGIKIFAFIGFVALCLLAFRTILFFTQTDEFEKRIHDFMPTWEKEFGNFTRHVYVDDSIPAGPRFPPHTNVTLPDPPTPSSASCSSLKNSLKIDCAPKNDAGSSVPLDQACHTRGCCYSPSNKDGVPACFYPANYQSYNLTSVSRSDRLITAELTANFQTPFSKIVPKLSLKVMLISDWTVVVLIVPSNTTSGMSKFKEDPLDKPLYDVAVTEGVTGFKVVRKSNGRILFDTTGIGALLFSSQYVEISTSLPSNNIYGLQEVRQDFPVDTNWNTFALFNHDMPPRDGVNSYGFYPQYMCLEGDGKAHSVTFGNFFATEFSLQPGALTYRSIGPPLAFIFVLGESPLDVSTHFPYGSNSHFPIDKNFMPPFWSLGFHLSRFGHKNTESMNAVWKKMKDNKIPFDTQWVDIDYMQNRNDFTIGDNFRKDLSKFVDKLHKDGMHFVPILDPGVSAGEKSGSYLPYDLGIKSGIFIKDYGGKKPLIGKVWNPKSTVFPDFTHPKSLPYWLELLANLYKEVPYDGIWIDMNDPSNFVNGSLTSCSKTNNLDNPPFVPLVDGGFLNYRTVCMSAVHYNKFPHYTIHNKYGFYETVVTAFSVAQIRGKRPFVLTRSGNLATSGYAAKWTGDVFSTWDDMKQSVKDIMSFSLLGLNMVGADICGFNGNTTQDLCRRWTQLGAFYPFSRNHNTDDAIDQDPVSIGIVEPARKSLELRYSLLPYLYTLFWQSHTTGAPVVRPSFFAFPDKPETFNISTQFLWGDALLFVPLLDPIKGYSSAYIGEKSVWYDLITRKQVNSSTPNILVSETDGVIPILLRGGHILPTFVVNGSLTTTALRKCKIDLLVARNQTNQAKGSMYWDDGETLNGAYDLIDWTAGPTSLNATMTVNNFHSPLILNNVEIFSVDTAPKVVTLFGKKINYTYDRKSKVLKVEMNIKTASNFSLQWS